MEEPQLLHLNLRTSLEYTEAPLVPFARIFPTDDETVEYIFCFELDQGQATRIDPDPSAFPGKLVFSGKRSDGQGISFLSPYPIYGAKLQNALV